MKVSSKRVFVLCTTVLGMVLFALGQAAHAQPKKINLTYEPQKGQSAVYDFQVHANARDKAGFSFVTHATSTLEIKVADVMHDPLAPVGENRVTGAVIEIFRKDGTVKFVSGDVEETLLVDDQAVKITTDKNGMMVKMEGGDIERSLTDTIAALCATLGADKEMRPGKTWTVPATLNFLGEKVRCDVVYKLEGPGDVDGDHCLIVSSACSLLHKFKAGGPVKSIEMAWNGTAGYVYDEGRFASIIVLGSASGELKDGTQAEMADFRLQMTHRKNAAAPPGAGIKGAGGGILGGGGPSPVPMILAAAALLGLVVVFRTARRPAIRKALVCILAAALAIYGMPFSSAGAASPGALIAFSNMVTQALLDAGGLTGAGGAGVFMSGTPTAVLSIPCAALPTWAGAGIQDVVAGLDAGFLQVSPDALASTTAGVGVAETAGGGLFTSTNMLVGGGIIAAGAGAGIAAAGGGGEAGCSTSTLTSETTDQQWVLFYLANPGPPDGEAADTIAIYVNNNLLTTHALNTTLLGYPAQLQVDDNDIRLECTDGGINTWAIVVFNIHKADSSFIVPNVTIKICEDNPARMVLNRTP
ncbi:MAG: hypothetical protein HQ592_02990 [Planctomycetes bacterium]|nr:hypothetical protein [Planctomycetota bacterium]